MADLLLRMVGEGDGAVGAFNAVTEANARMGAAITSVVKDSVKAFAEQEKADRQLKLVAGELTETFKKQASAMQNALGVSDDMVQGLQTLQLRFGQAPKDVEKTTKAVLDYAAATGKDATGSMEMLLRAVDNGGAGLSKLGITYESTGNKSEDLRRATDALAKKFGGAAQADAESLTGQVRIAEAAIGELKEGFGQLIIEFAQKTGTIDAATAAVKALQFALSDEKREMEEGNARMQKRTALMQEMILLQNNLKGLAQLRQDPEKYSEYLRNNESAFAGGVLTPDQQSARLKQVKGELQALDAESQLDALQKGKAGGLGSKPLGGGATGTAKSIRDEQEARAKAMEDGGKKLNEAYAKVEHERLQIAADVSEMYDNEAEQWAAKEKSTIEFREKLREASAKKRDAQIQKELDGERKAAKLRIAVLEEEAKDLARAQDIWADAGAQLGTALASGIAQAVSDAISGEKTDVQVFADFLEVFLTILGTVAGAAIGTYYGGAAGGQVGGQVGGAVGAAGGGMVKKEIYKADKSNRNLNPKHDGGWIERYHSGGWPGAGSDEVPIMAQTGERVLSRSEVRRMGGPGGVERATRGGNAGMTIQISTFDGHSARDYFEGRGGRAIVTGLRTGRSPLNRIVTG